jgi:uncharacterized protein (TIGR02217 family)
MTNFLDIKLPDFISINSISTPIFYTKVITSYNGRETRYPLQNRMQLKYKILSLKLNYEQFQEFNMFFTLCKGKQYSFRMKDFQDHSLDDHLLCFGPSEDKIIFIYKNYESYDFNYKRRITKILPDSVKTTINGNVAYPPIDYDLGVITLDEKLNENEELKISLQYEITARFDFDSFEYQYETDGTISIENLNIVEVVV